MAGFFYLAAFWFTWLHLSLSALDQQPTSRCIHSTPPLVQRHYQPSKANDNEFTWAVLAINSWSVQWLAGKVGQKWLKLMSTSEYFHNEIDDSQWNSLSSTFILLFTSWPISSYSSVNYNGREFRIKYTTKVNINRWVPSVWVDELNKGLRIIILGVNICTVWLCVSASVCTDGKMSCWIVSS